MRKETTLKPCPFCGGQGELLTYSNGVVVKCKNCGASIQLIEANINYCAKDVAIARWNERYKNA